MTISPVRTGGSETCIEQVEGSERASDGRKVAAGHGRSRGKPFSI